MQKKNEREEKKMLNTFLESVVTLREGKYCGQVIKKQTIPPSSQKKQNRTSLLTSHFNVNLNSSTSLVPASVPS